MFILMMEVNLLVVCLSLLMTKHNLFYGGGCIHSRTSKLITNFTIMKVIEFNGGIWIEYPDINAEENPCLKYDNSYYISITYYCALLGIECFKSELRESDGKLVLYLSNPIAFEKIAEITSWDKITIEPAYGNVAIAIAI